MVEFYCRKIIPAISKYLKTPKPDKKGKQ